MHELELRFKESSVSMLEIDGKKGFSGEMIGKALGYDKPGLFISQLHRRNDDEFEKGIDWDWFNNSNGQIVQSDDGHYTTRIYWRTGVNIISMLSSQPIAKEFRRWAKHVLADVQLTSGRASLNDKGYRLNRADKTIEISYEFLITSLTESQNNFAKAIREYDRDIRDNTKIITLCQETFVQVNNLLRVFYKVLTSDTGVDDDAADR